MTYSECQVLDLGIHRRLESVKLAPGLALALNLSNIRPGLSTATISAGLHVQDNKYVLKVNCIICRKLGRFFLFICFCIYLFESTNIVQQYEKTTLDCFDSC